MLIPLASLGCLILCSLHTAYAADYSLTIKSAAYNKKTHTLVVKTSVKGNASGNLLLLHGEGGILSLAPANKIQVFSLPRMQLRQVPCNVEARLANITVSKTVIGAPLEWLADPTVT